MKYGVFGPRDFQNSEYENYQHIYNSLTSFSDATKIYSGGSRGVERLVERFAEETDIPFQLIRPDIEKHGVDTAFYIRNTEIVQNSESVIVFWDGTGSRIIDLIAYCMRVNKEVTLVPMM